MKENYFLGGYTRRINQGLSSITFNSQAETFTERELIDNIQNPTYLALSKDNHYLFTIEKEEPFSGVAVYKKNNNDTWIKKDYFYHTQAAGCHLFYLDSKKALYLSNYHEGTIEIYKFNDDEIKHLQTITHEGSSVHPNQTQSRIHFASAFNQDEFLYVCDLGSDKVYVYSLAENGSIAHLEQTISVPAGTGPRHLEIHPNQKFVYIIGELNNTTILCHLKKNGHLEIIDSYSNISPDSHPKASGAAIKISNDGNFLYVSTRYQDQITLFRVDQTSGKLTHLQDISSYGKVPRDFCLSLDEHYLIAAHQDSDNLSLFKRDSKSGKLSFINKDTYAPECVCILGIPNT
ncbi:lactonase family protein [Facklamia sp. 7083-14-GEN3]|uniref:lactonase family protein n=1 Tax=Facklamia sp. 7083-14-GEN3 TaxID=2973478 RepID=UPI00215D01AF|nr:lactonase family protein [Facklamia sp. 7083-14-GEN3]MCR8968645.1 lactonase family protein [Facklamia sp. 7083-14-GEN3]